MLRRNFLAGAAGSLLAAPSSVQDRVCLFTDHLAAFDYQEVARMLKQLGVAGPDLTVRPSGLVKPERVREDLPRAAKIFKDHGLAIPMITTGITSAGDERARAVLETAAQLGIRYYKLGYYSYSDLSQWKQTLERTRAELAALADLNKRLGIQAGFHNHSGPSVGGVLWDSWEILQAVDPQWIGFYFDPGQATIEGGKNGWNLNFRRIAPRLKMVAIKDYLWEKAGGEWKTRWVPLGQGMVEWPAFFKLLREVQWPGPISLHIEYDPGGATKTARYDNSLAAAERDLKFLRRHIQEAFG